MKVGNTGRRVKTSYALLPVVLLNVGVLVALFFGPNGNHPNNVGIGAGFFLIGVGLVFAVRAARRFRDERSPLR